MGDISAFKACELLKQILDELKKANEKLDEIIYQIKPEPPL